MARHIAFLRAINVGGHTVKMDRLRALFEALGFRNVQTVIASGNVLFDATAKDRAALERRIERHLEEALGYAVATFLRSPDELAATLAHDPFARAREREERKLYIGFLKAAPPADVCRVLDGSRSPIDAFHVHRRELFWSLTGPYNESKFGGPVLEKLLKCSTTVRNVTTVRRIADLVS